MVEYRSVEEAVTFIYESEDGGRVRHPFFGFIPEIYNPDDIESGKVGQ